MCLLGRDLFVTPGWMAVEERVIEDKVSGMMEQLRRVGALLRQSALGLESLPYFSRRLRPRDGALRKRIKKICDAIDKLGTQFSKLLGTHGQRRRASLKGVYVVHRNPPPNSSPDLNDFHRDHNGNIQRCVAFSVLRSHNNSVTGPSKTGVHRNRDSGTIPRCL